MVVMGFWGLMGNEVVIPRPGLQGSRDDGITEFGTKWTGISLGFLAEAYPKPRILHRAQVAGGSELASVCRGEVGSGGDSEGVGLDRQGLSGIGVLEDTRLRDQVEP